MTPLNILTTAEQKQFNLPPVFTGIDQKRYFTFPADIMTIAKTLKPHNIVFFLVMYGYFKATNKFYNRKFHQKDIVYVAEKVGVPIEECSAGKYKSRTYLNHRELILKYTGFAKFGPKVEKLSPAAKFLGSALSFQSWHISNLKCLTS